MCALKIDAPSIETVSEGQSFVVGEEAVLMCQIDARPLSVEHIRWMRAGQYDMSDERISISFENGTSYLRIKNVQRSDVGNFTCVADNQRGPAAQRNVLLVVQCK